MMFFTCSNYMRSKGEQINSFLHKFSFFIFGLIDSLRAGQQTPKNGKEAEMLVFWHQRLTMLATPKTGTTAIESALESMAHVAIQRPPQLKHASVRKYHRFIAPWLESVAGAPSP
ncbi:hypothetical protein ACFSHQ_15300 [Gemmobacter lanyuensis]